MISFKKYLAEASVYDYMAGDIAGQTVPIYRIKSAITLNQLNLKHHELRGIVFNDYIDVWNSWVALHYEYERHVGKTYDDRHATIRLSPSKKSIINISSWSREEAASKRNIPIIQKLIKHPKVEYI